MYTGTTRFAAGAAAHSSTAITTAGGSPLADEYVGALLIIDSLNRGTLYWLEARTVRTIVPITAGALTVAGPVYDLGWKLRLSTAAAVDIAVHYITFPSG